MSAIPEELAQERKQVEVEFKIESITDPGEFEGLASVFRNVDLGKDIVHPGAFTKTIRDRNGRVPLMSRHEVPVGVAYVEETATGLKARGVLNLDKESAREIYSDIKFYRDHEMPMGMSIGYTAIPDKVDIKDGIRNLHEVKLFEVTLTEFPMNPEARVAAVKSAELREGKAGRRQSAASQENITRAMSSMQRAMDMLDENESMDGDMMAQMSGHVRRAMRSMQALLGGEAAASTPKEAVVSTAEEAVADTSSGAAGTSTGAAEVKSEPPAQPDVLADITQSFKEIYRHGKS